MYDAVLQEFNRIPAGERIYRTSEFTGKGMRQIGSYMYAHWDAFKLILCRSGDTAYSHLVEDMVERDMMATAAFCRSSKDAGVALQSVNDTLTERLSYFKFSLFFDMVTQDLPQKEMEDYIQQLLDFYIGGWEKLWGF